jgi:hypothetical protein
VKSVEFRRGRHLAPWTPFRYTRGTLTRVLLELFSVGRLRTIHGDDLVHMDDDSSGLRIKEHDGAMSGGRRSVSRTADYGFFRVL